MLTPVEIQGKSFKSGGLGYDKKDVDGFMREVLRSYEDMYRENMEQKDKLTVLNDGIQYYKTIEKTLQKALLLAEKTAEETRQSAQKEAKRIEKEAQTKANILLADARNELEHLHQQTIGLIQQYEKYKAQFRHLAAAQMEMLETDAFNINVARLDAFIDVSAGTAANHDKSPGMSQKEANSMETPDYNQTEDEAAAAYSNDSDDEDMEYSQVDFSSYEIDGQEEFDFLDLTDSES